MILGDTPWDALIKGAAGAVQSLFGQPQVPAGLQVAPQPKTNLTPILIAGGVGLVLITGLFFAFRK